MLSSAGLRRTGKSCRLRWVNYLHPGLKRGRITPDEERLILQLHSQWGSRWSRIARRLPGRTDNEIKNYWRTLTRKLKAADKTTSPETKKKEALLLTAEDSSSMSSSVTAVSSSVVTGGGTEEMRRTEEAGEAEETEEEATTAASEKKPEKDMEMEELWDEIAAAEMAMAAASWPGLQVGQELLPPPSSPAWEDYSLWRIDDEEYYSKIEGALN